MKTSDAPGFTLLELLVAVSVTAVLAVIMTGISVQALRVWERSESEQDSAIAAAQVLAAVQRDLQAAHWDRDTTVWLAADILDGAAALSNHGWWLGGSLCKPANGQSLRLVPPPDEAGRSTISEARFGLSGVWLRLVTTNVESGGSLPTVVAYQLARRPITGNPVAGNPAPVRYALYRSAVTSADAFAAGYDVTSAAYTSTTNSPSSALSTAYRQARNVMNPSHANVLAPNVVDFGCWLYVRDNAGGLVRVFPADSADVSHHAVGNSTAAASRVPEVADISLRILTQAGVAAIDALENGRVTRPPDITSDAAWWWSVVEANSRVFVRRVELRRSP